MITSSLGSDNNVRNLFSDREGKVVPRLVSARTTTRDRKVKNLSNISGVLKLPTNTL